jgi:hypothetical protein
MSTGSTFLLAVLAVVVMCVAVTAASKRPDAAWRYYHFDGRVFIAGQPGDGSPFLALREHVLPVVLTRMAKVEAVSLPPGKGALAGICYIHSSGGKLAGGRGYSPCPGMPLAVSFGDTAVLHMQTDESGFFVAVLPAGEYRISSGAFSAQVAVVAGTTTLSALQAGKRMVD